MYNPATGALGKLCWNEDCYSWEPSSSDIDAYLNTENHTNRLRGQGNENVNDLKGTSKAFLDSIPHVLHAIKEPKH